MRILKAYREIAAEATENKTYYDFSCTIKMNVQITAPTVLFKFSHNKQTHVIACLRDTDNLGSIYSAYPTEIIIITIIRATKKGTLYFIPDSGITIANGTSTTLVTSTVQGTENIVVIRSHNHTQPYLQFTNILFTATHVSAASTYAVSVPVPTGVLSLADPITLDIDKETVFGLTIQSFDFTTPDEPKTTVSNTFTLPKTINNEKLTNSAELLQDGTNQIYSTWYVDYWVDAHRHVEKARLMVSGIKHGRSGGRISCVIYVKDTIWDRLKSIKWSDFMKVYSVWVNSKTITEWTTDKPNNIGGFEDMVLNLSNATEHILLPLFYGDFYWRGLLDQPDYAYRTEGDRDSGVPEIYITQFGINGAHLCVYCKSIFECIKETYGLDLTGGGAYSIFNRAVEGSTFIQTRHLMHVAKGNPNVYTNSIVWNNSLNKNVTNGDFDKPQKTVYDFVKDFIRQTNAIIDKNIDGTFSLYSFEDIENAPIKDFSGGFNGEYDFSPMIQGVAQKNYIDFSDYSELLQPAIFKKTIDCNNKNIDFDRTLVTIPCFVPPAFLYLDYQMLAFYEKKSYKEFTLLIKNPTKKYCLVAFEYINAYEETTQEQLYPAVFYGLDYAYNKYQEVISYPKVIKAKKWISYEDVKDLKFFCLYHIKELGGTFFIQKIAGLNPDASKQPTAIELVFVNHKLPT